MEGTSNIHRRKSSKDLDDENLLIMPTRDAPRPPSIVVKEPPPYRSPQEHTRSSSVATFPSLSPGLAPVPSSAGPFRTSFSGIPNGRLTNGVNGLNASISPPAYKNTFGHGHSRTRSISGPFVPPQPSPLSSSFPLTPNLSPSLTSPTFSAIPPPPELTASKSLPLDTSATVSLNDPELPSPKHTRRHSRLHSRNLSIFFPRPGSLPTSTIAEDGSQELELKADVEAPVATIPSAGSSVQFPRTEPRSGHAPPTPLGAGFTFGGRPPSSSTPTPTPPALAAPRQGTMSTSSAKSRRGHHHKHSMSHSFFSFLEPGANGLPPSSPSPSPSGDLTTQPTPVPMSPWKSTSTSQTSPLASQSFLGREDEDADGIPTGPATVSLIQFLIGAWLWVCGQRIGSLSCTGVGYWVVFDAFGVGVGEVLPGWLNSRMSGFLNAREGVREALRRPYGNKRIITVFMFAQAVYLMFASVYVCKETLEHVLLTAGEGHHHHPGEDDNWIGIEFPSLMTLLTFFSTITTALLYNNHAKLINVTGNRIPAPSALIRSLFQSSQTNHGFSATPNTPFAILFSNPYTASPLMFCLAMFSIAVFLPPDQHRPADLFLAAIIAIVTFKVSYQACVVLGTVLLQTAPRRGLSSGKMESFLRVMREVERHPNILHLPAPHIWQLTPAEVSAGKHGAGGGDTLIVTVQVHVREDLGDDEVLSLTKWTYERCVRALGSSGKFGHGTGANGGAGASGGGGGGVEVTVGVVKG